MPKLTRGAIFKLFQAALQARYPMFDHVQKEATCWHWRAKASADLFFFVQVLTRDSMQKFHIEIAWSNDGDYPYKPGPASLSGLDITAPRGRTALAVFWASGLLPAWDLCPERTMFFSNSIERLISGKYVPAPELSNDEIPIRLPPLVDDAMAKFEQYGIPMFRKVAEAHGVAIPF